MDGTLSPDGKWVIHGMKWVPTMLSPDGRNYAHEKKWYPILQTSLDAREPCGYCKSTEYNVRRRCNTTGRIKGCGKIGCDFCFRKWGLDLQGYKCPECIEKNNWNAWLRVLISIPFFVIIGYVFWYVDQI